MTTTAFSLGNILGAQIRAVLEAEQENAEAIAEFITAVGFEPGEQENQLGAMRMVSFQMQRRNELGELETHTIQIPLLSILPIPMLSIEKVDFEFDLEIRDVQKKGNATSSVRTAEITPRRADTVVTPIRAIPNNLVATFPAKRRIKAPTSSRGSSERILESNMSVKVSIVQTDFPLGVEKLLNLSELGIQDQIISS